MASKRNPQNAVINSTSNPITVFTNPSTTAFAYVWRLQLTAGGASNLTFNNSVPGLAASPLSGPFALLSNGSITKPEGNTPWYTVDPGASFTITNSGGAQISGDCLWSN